MNQTIAEPRTTTRTAMLQPNNPRPDPAKETPAASDDSRKGRLLVVDDELGPRESVRVVFRDIYDVNAVGSGREGLDLARKKAFDVAVLDIRMPDLGGIDVLRQLKQLDPHVEVIMLTAYETLDTARDAIRYGASDYLNKPFDVRALRETVARCMENRRKKMASYSQLASLQQKTELLQREILNSHRALTAGVLVSGVIHDVNNPLSIIMIKAEMMLEKIKRAQTLDGSSIAEVKSGLELINRETERCRTITRRFLDLSRRKDNRCESMAVKAVLDDVISLVKAHADARDKELAYTIDDEQLKVAANPSEMLQILVNLCVNSVQAMKAGGQLKLAARRCAPAEAASVATGNGNSVCFRSNQFDASAPHVEITVADDGQGIPKDVLPRILEPYFTTKPRGQGTGLGLAICVQLLDHYKGAIKITSQAGAGTTCALYLPLAE